MKYLGHAHFTLEKVAVMAPDDVNKLVSQLGFAALSANLRRHRRLG